MVTKTLGEFPFCLIYFENDCKPRDYLGKRIIRLNELALTAPRRYTGFTHRAFTGRVFFEHAWFTRRLFVRTAEARRTTRTLDRVTTVAERAGCTELTWS